MSDPTDSPKDHRAIKWLDPNKGKVKKSKKHEQRLAKELGGSRQRRSGGTAWSKYDQGGDYGPSTRTDGRDITTDNFYIEHKHTEKESISLKLDWLEKIYIASRGGFKDPAVIVTFDSKTVNGKYKTADSDWILLPLSVAKKYIKI